MTRTKQAKRNLRKLIDRTIPLKAERALTVLLTAVGNKALVYTPTEHGGSGLLGSQDRTINKFHDGWRGTIVYTQDYAAALHEGTGWKPRPPEMKQGPAWNPKAEDHWMERADRETRSIQRKIIRVELKL